MNKQEALFLMKKVKENCRKLDSCAKHCFGEYPFPAKLGIRMICQNCGGELGITDIALYARGYRDHGGDPNDIISGLSLEPGSPA